MTAHYDGPYNPARDQYVPVQRINQLARPRDVGMVGYFAPTGQEPNGARIWLRCVWHTDASGLRLPRWRHRAQAQIVSLRKTPLQALGKLIRTLKAEGYNTAELEEWLSDNEHQRPEWAQKLMPRYFPELHYGLPSQPRRERQLVYSRR